jgi:hypothetical protein
MCANHDQGKVSFTKRSANRGEIKEMVTNRTDICLVVGYCGGALDVHAMAPGVVQLLQLHKIKHLRV